ncbi:hypothetical protein CCB80_08045 [Armatimonadetes bacterium Uphvl-Ar1]|nr:hypothetical protein CCB80_08045 [Armatimonadetes bacterium Uphvl-Ar1]
MNRLLALLCLSALSLPSFAAIVAQDNASDAVYNDGWQTGDNGGFGFNAWNLTASTANASNAGRFIGSSLGNAGGDGPQNIDTSGEAWGLYANGGNSSTAIRTFSVPVEVGNVYSFNLDNGFIDNGASITAGFYTAGNISVGAVDFIGGNPNYFIKDGATNVNSGVGFTGKGLTYTMTVTSATTYAATLTRLDGGGTFTHNGTFSGVIDKFQVFNTNAGGGGDRNLYVNSLAIDAVPEPATMLVLGLGAALAARRRK